ESRRTPAPCHGPGQKRGWGPYFGFRPKWGPVPFFRPPADVCRLNAGRTGTVRFSTCGFLIGGARNSRDVLSIPVLSRSRRARCWRRAVRPQSQEGPAPVVACSPPNGEVPRDGT